MSNKKKKASSTYYPEAYHYNFLRSLIKYLYQSHRFKDKILLEDIIWIDPDEEPRYRNQFNKLNSNFMGKFIYHDDERLIELMKRDSFWFFDRIIEILKNKKLKSRDKKNLIKKLNKILNEF